ncbi:MAG: diguanylate cyclase [Acidobacteria bacterium]|nr:diguanylate cyclase [Acidobacteriota bacterium]
MRILIADDSTVSRHLLESMVKKWGYDVVSTSDGVQAWDVLQQPDAPRLAILDWMMPGLTGPEVCKLVREKAIEPYVYILLLTSRTQKEDVIEGMMAGADDYVVKPFDQQELNVRLRAGRRIVDLQSQLIRAQAALRHQATHDALTGVQNRGRITEILDESVAEAGPLGVIMLDVDRFKSVNDTHGHAAGDTVLITVAERVRDALGTVDAMGRFGGEEFVIVSRREPEDLAALAESIRQALAAEPVVAECVPLQITASFGVASRPDGAECSGHLLVKSADEALYQAKQNGRNRVCIAKVPALEGVA